MKIAERQKATNLRKQGLTYREIQREIPVSRSCLSNWLKEIELTTGQIERIQYKNQLIKEKFIRYNKLKKEEAKKRRSYIIETAKKEINKISKRELKLLGIALYWAEGTKSGVNLSQVSFANSDPVMVGLMMRWFREICFVPETGFRLRFQAYNSQNIDEIYTYWSKLTGVPRSQFTAPYLRVTRTSKGKRGNILPYGTLHIRICDTALLSKILGWIEGIKALSSSPV